MDIYTFLLDYKKFFKFTIFKNCYHIFRLENKKTFYK